MFVNTCKPIIENKSNAEGDQLIGMLTPETPTGTVNFGGRVAVTATATGIDWPAWAISARSTASGAKIGSATDIGF